MFCNLDKEVIIILFVQFDYFMMCRGCLFSSVFNVPLFIQIVVLVSLLNGKSSKELE